MTPQQEQMLKEVYELVKDNNGYLRAARRNAFISGFFKMAFYAAMIVLPTYLFYNVILPAVTNTSNNAENKVQSMTEQLQSAQSSLTQIRGMLNAAQQVQQ